MPEESQTSDEASSAAPPPRRPWAGILFALTLAAIAVVVILASKPKYFVDPKREGKKDDYLKIVTRAEPGPGIDTELFKQLRITRTNESVRIVYPDSTHPDSRLLNYALHRVEGAGGIPTPMGRFSLRYQGIGYGEFESDELQNYDSDVTARYFDLRAGRLIPTNDVPNLIEGHERQLGFRGAFPKVRYLFEYPQDEKLKVISYHLFDANTKTRLTGGYSWGGQDGKAYVEMDVKKWHSGPVELVVDLATGPVETIEIPPREGEVIRQPDWELRLAAVVEGDSSGTSSGSRGTNSYVQIRFRENETRRPETSFLFLGNPWAYHLPVDIAVTGKDGKEMTGGGGGSSGRYVRKGIRGTLEAIDHVRATIYKDVKRVVFTLPTVYGLPKENDEITNLFETRIPYMRIKSKWEFREAIEGLAQLRFAARTPAFNPPPAYFPIEFHDTTPRELLEEYLSHSPQPQAVAVDVEQGKLILDEPVVQKLIKRIGKSLGK